MPLDSLSFSNLFHDGFRVEGHDLLLDAMLRNEIRRYVESALLEELLERDPAALPTVTLEEAQARFDAQREHLEYKDAEQTEEMLAALGISKKEVEVRLKRHLAVEKRVDQEIARLQSNPERRQDVLWKMFLDMSLRARVLKAAAARLLSGYAEAPANAESIDKVRQHLKLMHQSRKWAEVERHLTEAWGISQDTLSSLVESYARAMTTER